MEERGGPVHRGAVLLHLDFAGGPPGESWLVGVDDGVGDDALLHAVERDLTRPGHAAPEVRVAPPAGAPVRGPELVDVLVAVGTWAGTSAAWDLTKAAAAALARRAGYTPGPGRPAEPLREAECVARARWLVAARYGEDETALAVVEVDTAAETAHVTLWTGSREYTCWLELRDGLVTTARVRRREPR